MRPVSWLGFLLVMLSIMITDGTDFITYKHTNSEPRGNEYFSTSCALQYPVDGLKPGTWTVEVIMYPELTGVSLAQGTTGQAANTLTLSIPRVNIDPDNCPKGLAGEGDTNVRNGYIRQGERASCLCTRAHAGNPPGTIGWSTTHGGNFVIVSQREDASIIQISSPDGPSSASLAYQPPGPVYLCPSQQTIINITCQNPENSFNPRPLFTIWEGDRKNLVTKTPGDTAWSKSVNYNFIKSGQYKFTCRVESAIFNDMFSEAPTNAMLVYAPPNSPPSFKVTGRAVKTDDSGTWVKQGSDISVSCLVGEAYPLVTSVIVSCGQETSSSGQLSLSGVSDHRLVCLCDVDHETKTLCKGHNLSNEMTIQTAYGPNEVRISLADDQLRELPNEPLNLCNSASLELTVICAVKQFDVRPGLALDDFLLIKTIGFTIQKVYSRASEGQYRLVNKLQVTNGGVHILVCEAKNRKFSDIIKQSQSMTVVIREPPSDPPTMSARSSQHGDILVEGDDVSVICRVSGGIPSVQSVTLTCGQDQQVTSNGASAELTLKDIRPGYNETNCTCQATHVTGCYNVMGVLPLTVISVNPTQARTSEETSRMFTTGELAGAVIGGIIGTLVLVTVIVLIVYWVRREQANARTRNTDTEYDTIERRPPQHYQNVTPHDPNYLTMDLKDRSPGNERTKHETAHTHTNQAYGDYIEPIETDLNAYSDIEAD